MKMIPTNCYSLVPLFLAVFLIITIPRLPGGTKNARPLELETAEECHTNLQCPVRYICDSLRTRTCVCDKEAGFFGEGCRSQWGTEDYAFYATSIVPPALCVHFFGEKLYEYTVSKITNRPGNRVHKIQVAIVVCLFLTSVCFIQDGIANILYFKSPQASYVLRDKMKAFAYSGTMFWHAVANILVYKTWIGLAVQYSLYKKAVTRLLGWLMTSVLLGLIASFVCIQIRYSDAMEFVVLVGPPMGTFMMLCSIASAIMISRKLHDLQCTSKDKTNKIFHRLCRELLRVRDTAFLDVVFTVFQIVSSLLYGFFYADTDPQASHYPLHGSMLMLLAASLGTLWNLYCYAVGTSIVEVLSCQFPAAVQVLNRCCCCCWRSEAKVFIAQHYGQAVGSQTEEGDIVPSALASMFFSDMMHHTDKEVP